MPDPGHVTLDEHRHNELVEQLRRIGLGIEALHQQGERRLRASASLEAKLESLLTYLVRCWQAVRGTPENHNQEG